ncbi:hypothetical protein Droror1_Dr00014900 [Drosera rotundifolia]
MAPETIEGEGEGGRRGPETQKSRIGKPAIEGFRNPSHCLRRLRGRGRAAAAAGIGTAAEARPERRRRRKRKEKEKGRRACGRRRSTVRKTWLNLDTSNWSNRTVKMRSELQFFSSRNHFEGLGIELEGGCVDGVGGFCWDSISELGLYHDVSRVGFTDER